MKKLLHTLLMASICLPVFAAGPLRTDCSARMSIRNESASDVMSTKKAKVRKASTNASRIKLTSGEVPIVSVPDGEVKTYKRSGVGVYEQGFYPVVGADEGLITEVVWCENGDVYIKNPLLFYNTNAYMKGHVENDEIVVDLPQMIERYTTDDPTDPDAEYVELSITILKGQEDYSGDLEFLPEEGSCQLRYKIDGDSFGREADNEDYTMLGLVWDDFFMDYGEFSCLYEPFSATPIEVPGGLETEEWACTYSGDGHYVGIAFKDQEVYIKGIVPSLPDSWIKGSMKGNTITFSSEQYLGVSPTNQHMAYFYGATMRLEEDPDWGDLVMTPHFADEITFIYDADAKIMSSSDAVLINASITKPYYLNLLDKPMIRVAPDNSTNIPNNPIILNFVPAAAYGVGAVQFDLPRTTTDGAILDTENMYYNVYFENSPVELIEGMPNIPWNYSDGWDFSVYGITHEAYYYERSVANVGIQNCYDNNGVITKSDIVYTDGTVVKDLSGVDSIVDTKVVVGADYIDLFGRRVTNPESGVYVRTLKYSDGSVSIEKIMVQ